MANTVVELLEISTPSGDVRLTTSPNAVSFDGKTWSSVGLLSLSYNQSSGGQPGGLSVTLTSLPRTIADELAIDIGWGHPIICYVIQKNGASWDQIYKISGRISNSDHSSNDIWSLEIEPVYTFIQPKNERYSQHEAVAFAGEIHDDLFVDEEW